MKLKELLNLKDFKHRAVVTIAPNDTMSAAIEMLVKYDRSSLPVCSDKGELVGIISERDLVRKFLTWADSSAKKIKVKDIMSTELIIGNPDDDLNYAITVMKEKRIRHLPIVDNRKVIGVISMRDLLGVQLEETNTHARFLSDYISGGYAHPTS